MKKPELFEEFVKIMRRLRAKEGGCPWDSVQTHKSLRPCLTEETAEFLQSIRIWEETGDAENMREELGDLMLQVVLHSLIAEEEGLFTIDDVIKEVSEKMIRRHPHIFGKVKSDSIAEIRHNWEDIKKEEKKGKSWIKSPLLEIPEELPSLDRAKKVVKKAEKIYHLPIDEPKDLVLKAKKELEILEKAAALGDQESLEKVFGEILWTLSETAYKTDLSPEMILSDQIASKIAEIDKETQ
ncbi:MAG: MazG family protein [Lachnospiraceae bacterium]|nr:MazG family protein [Lachnospiraceae bacterium]